jgi:hypothetical protein
VCVSARTRHAATRTPGPRAAWPAAVTRSVSSLPLRSSKDSGYCVHACELCPHVCTHLARGSSYSYKFTFTLQMVEFRPSARCWYDVGPCRPSALPCAAPALRQRVPSERHSVAYGECAFRLGPSSGSDWTPTTRRARWQSRSWQGSACATCRGPDGTRPATATISATMTATTELAPPRPALQHPHRHGKRLLGARLQQQCSA